MVREEEGRKEESKRGGEGGKVKAKDIRNKTVRISTASSHFGILNRQSDRYTG